MQPEPMEEHLGCSRLVLTIKTEKHNFLLTFGIIDFYPTISDELLCNFMVWARKHVSIRWSRFRELIGIYMLLLSTPLHQRAASRVQHPNHVAANSLSPQVARKGSTLSGFVQRSRLEREVGRDLHSNKWEEV